MPEVPAPLVRQRFLRRTWVRRGLPAGVAVALVVGGTAVTRANASSTPIDTYRSTTVTTGSVQQHLNVTGSVQRVNQVSQGFAVAGTVTSVPVSVGDTVTAGQTLATIDPRPFHSAVTAAQASLAKARATLESDQTSTATTSTSGTTGTSSVAPAPTATATLSPRVAGPAGRSGATASQSLTQVQARVTSAQKAVTADLAGASAALAQCASFFPAEPAPSTTSPAPTPTATPPRLPPMSSPAPATSTTTTATTTTTTTTTTSDAAIKACLTALRTTPTQQQIQRDQQALTRSQSDLMTSITNAITNAGTSGASSTPTSSATTGQSSASRASTSQTAGQSSGGQNGGAGQPSASRVISDQAAVTSAEGALSSSQANLATATLKSSIAGTVGSVTLVTGASSSGQSVVIVGTGAVEVTVDVPLASMASVRVGQKADVTPQGATTSVPGSVTSISLLPASSTATSGASAARSTQSGGTGQGSATSSSPVYPVVVLVPAALPALASGSRADVSLLVGTAALVLTVPNSALTPVGNGQAMAVTLKNGVATRALVTTGYAGTLVTQVTSGLVAGQQVVLADLSTALPTNTTNARRFGVGAGGATGGFGGSGLGGAGLGGASIPGGARFPSPG